ncbi:hypothetical protein [Pseudomonas sp. DSP3-2-2]|uniref:hypothetical protein n=1 Tax=unclassified Pseudomonas TaxID=196821 RepID=UPI003CF84443
MTDLTDNSLLKLIESFYKGNESTIIKGAPLLIGFLIFFIYFMDNSFFPAIDLFSLVSLLTAAFIIGSFFIIATFLGLIYPAKSWFHLFLADGSIWGDITGGSPANQQKAKKLIHWFFTLPVIISCSLNTVIIEVSHSTLFKMWAFFITAAVVSVTFGGAITKVFNLSASAFKKYVMTIWPPLIFSNFICFGFEIALLESDETNNGLTALTSPAITGTCIGLLLILITIYTIQAKSIRTTFMAITTGFAVMILMGMQHSVPSQIVKTLGVGNYTARSIILKPEMCQSLKEASFIIDHCTIGWVHVIWELGDAYKISYKPDYRKIDKNGDRLTECPGIEPCGTILTLPKDSVIVVIK